MPPEEDGPDRFAAGVDVALRYRAPLVEVILKAEPIGAIKVPSSRPRTRMGSSSSTGVVWASGRRPSRQKTRRAGATFAAWRMPLDLFFAFACVLPARLVYKAFARIYKSVYKAPRPGSRRSRSIRRALIRATCHSLTLIAPRSSASTKGPPRRRAEPRAGRALPSRHRASISGTILHSASPSSPGLSSRATFGEHTTPSTKPSIRTPSSHDRESISPTPAASSRASYIRTPPPGLPLKPASRMGVG
jgi:hypothetical protein